MATSIRCCLRTAVHCQLLSKARQPITLMTQRQLHKEEGYIERLMLKLYGDYELSKEGVMTMAVKENHKTNRESQRYEVNDIKQLGSDLAAAERILKLNGRVQFAHDMRWLSAGKNKNWPLPSSFKPGFNLMAIDASKTNIYRTSVQYLDGLEHLVYLNLSSCQLVDDWYVAKVAEYVPEMQFLDISYCQHVSVCGLESLFKLRKLKVLNIIGCKNVIGVDVLNDLLLDFNPELIIRGIEELPAISDRLHDHELRISRYMNWGEKVPDTYWAPAIAQTSDIYGLNGQTDEEAVTSESEQLSKERSGT